MKKNIIMRFRDLITEDDGTINDHLDLLTIYGEVWWGWWMRQYEKPPRDLFKNMSNQIDSDNVVKGFLFNTGNSKFYETKISRILVAPVNNKIGTPDPELSPSYYHRGQYPAWFLLTNIKEVDFTQLKLVYDSFPTRPDLTDKLNSYVNNEVRSLEELRNIDVTLWVVRILQS